MEKFKAVLHYIVSQCGHKDNVGKTVMYKLLYFSDFDFYELFEEKMTGESYKKLSKGPAPENFNSAISELESEGKITEKRVDYGKAHQYRYSSLKEPDMELLSIQEIKVINDVLGKCSSMSARKISDYSYEDLPWQAADLYKPINYELVFYRTPAFSVREYEEDED